jgi:exopolyphosphatase/guanosine-5'-triphosphate,3'-diphosphate pyrophosphatase
MKKQKKNLVAIDVGTNSFHLVAAEINPANGRFKILGKEKEVVRLGSGSTDMKHLSEEAMRRGIVVLKRFRAVADAYRSDVRAIATSAVREATNRQEFQRRVRSETGIRIEIASGFEEARLIHLGVLQALPVFNKNILLIDIGGGSTEFLVGQKRKILFSNSLKLGAVRMTERFFRSDHIDRKAIDECREYVRGLLAPCVREIKKHQFEVCVGTSGTINILARIISARNGKDSESPMNGYVFTRAELLQVVEEILQASTTEQRMDIEGMDVSRVDIISAGAVILEQIMLALKIKTVTVSDYSLREGIILDSIEKLHTKQPASHLQNIRRSSVLHLAETFHYEKNHANHVAALSLQLFDRTRSLHRLGGEEREYLEAAALLHEIGLFISHAQHHRHSYYLIRNSELLGFTENEKEIIANIARYHRKSHPKFKHDGYNILSLEDQRKVTVLAAILRVADGLDRSHLSLVKKLRTRVLKGTLFIRVHSSGRVLPEMELWGADRKKQLLQEVFRKRVLFTCAQ